MELNSKNIQAETSSLSDQGRAHVHSPHNTSLQLIRDANYIKDTIPFLDLMETGRKLRPVRTLKCLPKFFLCFDLCDRRES